ncbi:MAG: O-antigen ligase family protein [Bacteroidales bacterium]|nr:O-antigen ligase family protein [Bacteroidales bacterium]
MIKEILNKASLYSLSLLVFALPFYEKIMPPIIAFAILINIINGIVNRSFRFNKKILFALGIAFFVIHVISAFYSNDQHRAWFDIEVKLGLLFFPIVFSFKTDYIHQNKHYIYISFVLGSVISSLLLLFLSALNYKELGDEAFHYTQLARFIHPSYLAMYYIFSIAILIKYMVSQQRPIDKLFVPAALIILLLRMVFLLQSKAGILTMIAVSIYLLVLSIIRLRSLLLKIAIALIALSVVFISIQNSQRLQSMFSSVKEISENGSSDDSTTGVRYSIWKLTAKEISKHWLFGVGAGDIKPTLFKDYSKTHLDGALEKQLNVHNQYLETFLGQGIFGFLLLLALLFYGIKKAYKYKEWMMTIFIIIIAFGMIPESMLNKQSGVIFISFFYYFIFQFADYKDENTFLKSASEN